MKQTVLIDAISTITQKPRKLVNLLDFSYYFRRVTFTKFEPRWNYKTKSQRVLYKKTWIQFQGQQFIQDLKTVFSFSLAPEKLRYQMGAVSFDAKGLGNNSAGTTSLSWNHTVSGSDTYGVSCVSLNGANSNDVSTGMSWNSVAGSRLTRSTIAADGLQGVSYSIASPTSGTTAVNVTFSSSSYAITANSISYTGATSINGVNNTNDQTGVSSISNAIVSTSGGMATDCVTGQGGVTYTASGSNVARIQDAHGGGVVEVSTQAGTGGSVNNTWSKSGSSDNSSMMWNVVAVAAPTNSNFLMFM